MQQTNERKRLRMSCRPLLQLIHHLMDARSSFSDARLSHVKAHTTDSDIDSVGNRLADYQANVVRARPNRPSPLQVQPLPIQQCEHYLRIDDEKGIMIIEDIRRATLKRLRSLAVAKWRAKPLAQGQYYFAHASDALVQLGRVVLQQASADCQAALMLIATNSIHYYWPRHAAPGAGVQQLTCSDVCNHSLSLEHLAICTASPRCVDFRAELQHSIIQMLEQHRPLTTGWLHNHAHHPLPQLLLNLFPMSSCSITTVFGASDGHTRRDFHQTANMCGIYSGSQLTAAIKTLGFHRAAEGQPAMQQLRLLCIKHIQLEYYSRKQIAIMAQAPP